MNPVLAALLPLAQPVLTLLWTDVVYPEILKLETEIGNADMQKVAASVAAAFNTFAQAEIAKV